MFYFECTYRSKSEWQRNIPAHPQSDSSHCTKFFISCFKPSKPNPPTQTRAALRANQNAGGFVFWRGVREICPVCFDQCCQTHATETIKPNTHTHSLHNRRVSEGGINRIWHDSFSNGPLRANVTHSDPSAQKQPRGYSFNKSTDLSEDTEEPIKTLTLLDTPQ